MWPQWTINEDGRKDDDLAKDTLANKLAGDGHGVTLDKGVLKDFRTDGELVICPIKDFLVGKPTDGRLLVNLAEEVLVDVLAKGDLVDVPADVLEPNSRLDVRVCGHQLGLGDDQAGVLLSSLQRE